MIKVLENLVLEDYITDEDDKIVNTESEEVQEIIDEILNPLDDDKIKVQYVDTTNMPDEFDLYIEYEISDNINEYVGMWEVDCDKSGINNYSAYLSSISDDIDAAISGLEITEE